MEKLSLSDFRRRNGLTQQALADRLGVSRNYVALIENGRKPFTEKMRTKLSIVNNAGAEPERKQEETHRCPRCAELEGELREARAVIRDQASALASALAAKPSPAAGPACGVDSKETHKERKLA